MNGCLADVCEWIVSITKRKIKICLPHSPFPHSPVPIVAIFVHWSIHLLLLSPQGQELEWMVIDFC